MSSAEAGGEALDLSLARSALKKKANQPKAAVRLARYKTHELVARLSGLVILWQPPLGLFETAPEGDISWCGAGRHCASLSGSTPISALEGPSDILLGR